ncbi:UV radiation resistance protein and autophagy-related subunit 14-domain-containing protein [Dichomitus squalens]|uniref:Autophagy-related protein 14 n=1 Tax=Dichomitus squalens TaxID=114155 RepID=A0A4Q9PW07_9APHY|nr:UV radiation resistance protein and autophagy-related subunit 14-domain-containing protein [Dichomitus squalens]
MPTTKLSSWNGSNDEVAAYPAPTLSRRIRHITSIQVRNLTPFPVRDALASALTKPSAQPQFTPHGRLSDDLDVTVGRKRGRRVSTASSIHSVPRSEEDGVSGSLNYSGEPTLRRRSSSRASIPTSTSVGSSSPKLTRQSSNIGYTSSVRPAHRARALSIASTHSHQAASSVSALSGDLGTSSSAFFPGLLRDTSQKSLEKILQSRLVETFVTVTLLSNDSDTDHGRAGTPSGERAQLPSPSPSRPNSPSLLVKNKASMKSSSSVKTMARRVTVGSSNPSATARSPATPTPHSPSPLAPSVKSVLSTHGKSASVSLLNSKTSNSPATPSRHKAPFPAALSTTCPTPGSLEVSQSSLQAVTLSAAQDEALPVPDYISPIHWPSINPVFQLSRHEFAPGTRLSGAKMRVDIWGRMDQEGGSTFRASDSIQSGRPADTKGKGKEKQVDGSNRTQWKVLESWKVVLDQLKPLPQDLAANPSHLPSNTLLISLSSGETLYLPARSLQSHSPSRAPSPNVGYNSDPETGVHKMRGTAGEMGLRTPRLDGSLDDIPASPTISELDGTSTTHFRRKRAVKSANWQDLLKLINLQSVILDTQQSLNEVVRQIDRAVVHNEARILAREVSERAAWVHDLNEERLKVDRDAEELRKRITARREDLRRRRAILKEARRLHEADLKEGARTEEIIAEERARLSSLRNLLPIMRSNLISIVSFIYPIDLVSPPDLLFSILNVPLPIPVAATDPAPPLSLPASKDVTEDSVATALGFAAQLVQLLAAYMGHRLLYPVTCVGSRSMIKDGISAMVGPRNFPLFSKGVDTYRFEYGVFLLNKDIEMLMSERNLRALDMRHTLPNLKNLLLTLTDNEQRSIPGHRVASSSVSISSLQSESAVPAKSSLSSEPTSGTDAEEGASVDKHAPSGPSEDGTTASRSSTPPASGTTTPTKSTPIPRKSRAYFDLAPFTGFLTLRGRSTASQKPSVKAVAETPDSEAQASLDTADADGSAAQGEAADGDGEGGDDEDDRRTIRGVGPAEIDDEEEVVEGKAIAEPFCEPSRGHPPKAKSNAKGGVANGREKVVDDPVVQSPPLVLS